MFCCKCPAYRWVYSACAHVESTLMNGFKQLFLISLHVVFCARLITAMFGVLQRILAIGFSLRAVFMLHKDCKGVGFSIVSQDDIRKKQEWSNPT